jgi:hypothetical protein
MCLTNRSLADAHTPSEYIAYRRILLLHTSGEDREIVLKRSNQGPDFTSKNLIREFGK